MSTARAGLIAALLAALVACNEGRFPVCKSNADCADRDAGYAGNVCYNLKCVECHYDGDCAAGKTCNAGTSTCESLGETAAGPEPDAGASDHMPWEHGTWDQCAADCKERECIKACDVKFARPSGP